MATAIRKELNKQKWEKLLLKDATMWHITKHVYTKYEVEFWATIAFVELAIIIWIKL